MSKRYKGGVISATAPTSSGAYQCSTAPGIWTRQSQLQFRGASNWPTAGNIAPGSQSYTTAGTYSWVAPAGVTSVSVVAVGGGNGGYYARGGSAGALAYANNITVVPGNAYSVVVGAAVAGAAFITGSNAGFSSFNTSTVKACGGQNSGTGGTVINGTGGSGGAAASAGGGAGAGGYSGSGGAATSSGAGNAGAGGGGGSAGARRQSGCNSYPTGGGGGVGILGQGSNGTAGTAPGCCGGPGGGGSGGASGNSAVYATSGGNGGAYGAGGGSGGIIACSFLSGGSGGVGAVRIIWPGTTRSFPSTCAGSP